MSAPARPQRTAAPMQGSWETITSALETAVGPGRPSGAWTKYCCPVHEGDGRGHKPSLGVKYDDAGQRTVVRCFAGCDNEQVLGVLGLRVRDMFDRRVEREGSGRGRRANRPRSRQLSRADRAIDAAGLPLTQPKKPDPGRQLSPWRTVATYPYLRADGTVAGEVVRKEAPFEHTGRDKQFHQRRWNPTVGGMEAGGFDPLPYQLPQLLEAIDQGRTVYIVEGEKDVVAAESAGLTATTNAGGAMSWTAAHAQWLRGARTVVIVADRDPAGYRRAERVMATLSGLVERVRVVQAATGKDLHDHLQCGHEIAELEPIPYLDPFVSAPAPTTAPGRPAPSTEASTDVSASAENTTPGGHSDMAEYLLAPSTDTPPPQSDEVDHAGQQMAALWRALVHQLLSHALKVAEQRRRDAEELARRTAVEKAEAEERLALERKSVETKLAALRKQGWDAASRDEIADALTQARAWAPDSEQAAATFDELRHHLQNRFGLRIDPRTDAVDIDPDAAAVVTHLADFERSRAIDARLVAAQNRMVEAVGALDGIDESTKQTLYADIEAWRTNPSPQQLDVLATKLAAAKVPERTRTQIRFTAVYLYDAGAQLTADEHAERGRQAPTTLATHILRQTEAPLVDPGEEAKPRIDALLVSYQDRLRTGADTSWVTEKLGREVAALTEEDRTAARERGKQIRHNPAGKFAPLWPDHVDRDALAVTVSTYATLRPQADRAVVATGDYNTAQAAGLRQQADKHRNAIVKAIKTGKGLHDLERDQLAAVLRDIDAGRTRPPAMLFVDDRSAAQHDADRAGQIASETSRIHRRQLDEILSTARVDPVSARATRDEITRVMDAQTALAAGRQNLHDYGESGVEDRLQAAMTAVGIPEPVRNQVRNHLDRAAGEAAIAGKQANRIRDRWLDRHEAVTTARSGQPAGAVDYDSPQRREGLEAKLRASGLSEDCIAQRMAADTGHAKPPSAAPAAGMAKRRTSPGTGMQRIHHRRGKGRGPEQGLGR
ncbi:toprim domain-containing protein [Nocardia farcinica]|uniref:toprim domain-containing protein n=1 Tax=Nocardia farcinica TaxID=37329 RepID=UPI002453F87A|nr:toprim domain-containing protein [Nocardia farcinica]